MGLNILKRKTGIEQQVELFLNLVSQSGLIYKQGFEFYLNNQEEEFQHKLEQITKTESQGDTLRRSLEEQLYTKTLIPESRGDVLELLEEMDTLSDRFKGALWRINIELPKIPEQFQQGFLELSNCVVNCVEATVMSARAFFKNLETVSDNIHKVSYWETEADKVSTRLQRSFFRAVDLDLSHRLQLKGIVRSIDKIADRAEDVGDKLSIYVIKRKL